MISKTIVGALLIAAPLSVLTASAQTWPAKAVRIIVPQPPGGTTDLQARLLAKKYNESLGQAFVVDNRAGASGMIGFESDNWFGLFAPTGTPKEIVARLHSLALEALKAPELRDIISKDGGDVIGSTPEELGSHLKSEVTRYAKVIKAGKITAE